MAMNTPVLEISQGPLSHQDKFATLYVGCRGRLLIKTSVGFGLSLGAKFHGRKTLLR
jgi:hypothetical protein